jgi:hypothetical protein
MGTQSQVKFNHNAAERIAFWRKAYIIPVKARRIGDSYDWDTIPAGFGIQHPVMGLLTWYPTRTAAQGEINFAIEHNGVTRNWFETATPQELTEVVK